MKWQNLWALWTLNNWVKETKKFYASTALETMWPLWSCDTTLGTRGFFSRVAGIFGQRPTQLHRPKPQAEKPWQKPETALERSLAPRVLWHWFHALPTELKIEATYWKPCHICKPQINSWLPLTLNSKSPYHKMKTYRIKVISLYVKGAMSHRGNNKSKRN